MSKDNENQAKVAKIGATVTSGMGLGALLGGPIGAAVGAGIGAVAGFIVTQKKE